MTLKPFDKQTEMVENLTFDEINIGEQASLKRTVTIEDIELFAVVSGDSLAVKLARDAAKAGLFPRSAINGMLGASLVSNLIGLKLPGPGTVLLREDLQFLRPATVGDVLTTTMTVTAKDKATHEVLMKCGCINQEGAEVLTGTVKVKAPLEKIVRPRLELPQIRFSRHERFQALMADGANAHPPVTIVVHPCSAAAIGAAIEAAEAKLILPILVGPIAKIKKAAIEAGVELDQYRIVDTPHSVAAAHESVQMVARGEAQMLMKGSLHTDELLHAVLAKDSNLRTERRLSHVYIMDVPAYPRPLLITDAAVNIAPDLATKRDIIQNAIDLAHAMGLKVPRVAILSAVETINSQMQSTLDAAALCKMADRGQITGALLDGPLAFDNAISPEAAHDKGIVSQVAGRADILVVPDLEAGNMLAKQLTFLAGADAAGVVLGARVPIILTSRADAERTRMASCAVAARLARQMAANKAKGG